MYKNIIKYILFKKTLKTKGFFSEKIWKVQILCEKKLNKIWEH
jgi:hypothetical protein